MEPDRIPKKVRDVFFDLWAREGFDLYWKVTPTWERGRLK